MFSKTYIFEQLKKMNAPQDSVVLVHSSLHAIGETEGRGEGLLDMLIEYFTEKGGLLCIPTHTWANIYDNKDITLDMCDTKTCIGTLPNLACAHKDAVRSMHPTHSMAVFGDKKAAEIFADGEEKFSTPANPQGCYGKIYERSGKILLIGVCHNRNTYIHCVEEMLDMPNRLSKTPKIATVREINGKISRCSIYPHDSTLGDVSLRYPRYEAAFCHHNCITYGKIGNADAMLCDARKMKEVIELIYHRSGENDVLASDSEIDKHLYV